MVYCDIVDYAPYESVVHEILNLVVNLDGIKKELVELTHVKRRKWKIGFLKSGNKVLNSFIDNCWKHF